MIPLPREIRLQEESIALPYDLEIISPPGIDSLDTVIELFKGFYSNLQPFSQQQKHSMPLQISFIQMPCIAASHKDMYLINIKTTGIDLAAKSSDGFRHALATLRQMVFKAVSAGNAYLKCGQIIDYPALDYRGLHLDESRHFFGKNTVLSLLEYMYTLKLNHLHWHLSDDQGWRVESKLFPLLSEISAWRIDENGQRYGGFYTHEDIKEIVAYAKALGITIVPEFDFPGHSLALLAAYPALACDVKKYSTANSWGIFEDIICAGKPQTMDFLQALLSEYAELFPGPFFHIGGDEAPKSRWEQCPHCSNKLQELSLQDFEALQGWFTNQLAAMLKACGKTAIAWDEVLMSQVDSALIAMLWRGDGRAAAEAAKAGGNRYILCPNRICYLDWKASADSPGAHGISSLENVYSIDYKAYPSPELCLGIQANLWTEYIHNPRELFNMMHPRALALAERAWNPGQRYDSFQSRLGGLEDYFAALS